MTSIQMTPSPTEINWSEIEPPKFSDIILQDRQGHECITEEGLDWIWPRDNRPPLMITGKGFQVPPTCKEHIPCDQKYDHDTCMEYVFGEPDLPVPPVPISGTFPLLLIALVSFLITKKVAS